MKITVEMDEKHLPTQQDTEMNIFGAAPDVQSWWSGFEGSWNFTEDTPNGWSMTVNCDNPEGPGRITKIITHSVLMGAIRRITSGEVEASDEAREACRDLLFNRDAVDFDANTADEVLQVAVLGSVVYG